MAIQLKRNDTKDTISYTMTYADGTPVNLTGATVRFVMGKGKTLITSAAATIISATTGKVEYTLKESDTLVAGNYNAEFEVTFSDGKIKTFPSDGYISLRIQPNVDNDLSTYIEDQVANRVSDLQIWKNQIQTQLDQFAVGNSTPEVAQSRVEADGTVNATLKARLDKKEAKFASDIQTLSSSVAQKATKEEVDQKVAQVASGSPKGTFATLTDLQTAFPSGDSGNYILQLDGHIYNWNGTTWIDTGILYQAAGIAKRSVKVESTTFINPASDQNIFNPYTVTDGYRLNSNGTLFADALYTLSDFIPVVSGKTYKVFTGGSNAGRVCGYDINKVFIKVVDTGAVDGESEIIDFNGFIRIPVLLTAKFTTQIVDVSIYNGTFTPFSYAIEDAVLAKPKKNSVETDSVKDEAIAFKKTNFVSEGKNLFNPVKRTLDLLLPASTSSVYDTTEFIPIKSGIAYNINKCRKYTQYDTNKNIIGSTFDNPSSVNVSFTATQDGFLRATLNKNDINTFQIEIGSSATSYEPWGLKVSNLLLGSDSVSEVNLNQALKEKINYTDKKISVTKNGNLFQIRRSFDNVKDIVMETDKFASENGSFKFVRTLLVDKNELNIENGEQIHSGGDDITPIRTFATVGANHGYTSVIIVTMSGHGKTTADLGSRWTDGATTYTLLAISSINLTFGCPYTVTDGIVSSSMINPVSSLTHVSGATNTTSVTTTTLVSSPQLKPSINNRSVRYMLDGKEIITDSTYYGNDLVVKESYNVMDYKAIIDYAQSNIGVSYTNDSVDGVVRLGIDYVFGDKGSVVIHHNYRALKKHSILHCGFIQSAVMEKTGYKVLRYMPNVLPKGGYDFKTPVDLTSYNQSLIYTSTDLLDPTIPPNRTVDWLVDSTTGVKKAGFTMGYIVDKSNSKNSERIANSASRLWDMRDTLKNYPNAIQGKTYNVGDYLNFICYRSYLSPNWVPDATNFNVIKDKKDTYVYIDYHTSVSFKNIPLDEHVGKDITVLEKSSSFTVHNSIVDADGVLFSVSGGYGYAILKLN
jgi:hypothetical protein